MTTYPEHARWHALFELFKERIEAVQTKVDTPPLSAGVTFSLTGESEDLPHLFIERYTSEIIEFCKARGLDVEPLVVETTYLCKRGFYSVVVDQRQGAQHTCNLIIRVWRLGHKPEEAA